MTDSLVPLEAAQRIANLAHTNPELVYKQIKQAEDWLEEMKQIARKSVISRMNGEKKIEIDADTYKITATASKPKIKVKVLMATLAAKQIDKALLVYPLPIEYDLLPNCHELLKKMFETKMFTQAEYDSFFEVPSVTVKVVDKKDNE